LVDYAKVPLEFHNKYLIAYCHNNGSSIFDSLINCNFLELIFTTIPSVGFSLNNFPFNLVCLYLRRPVLLNKFSYGKAHFPTVNEPFVFVVSGVDDL